MRYPVLWERTAPDGLESAGWSWADERLERLRELGIQPREALGLTAQCSLYSVLSSERGMLLPYS